MMNTRIIALLLQVCLLWGLVAERATAAPHQFPDYDRKAFGSWLDIDRDCLNTRHELLLQLSTAATRKSKSGCSITRGRWVDPYTGKVFLDSRKLDVDHLVPLAFAWKHGAGSWTDDKRKTFANDPRNLMVVQASVNRKKGAKGPLDWLPPNEAYHCQYVLRFLRVFKAYKLEFSDEEHRRFETLKETVCKKPAPSG